MRFIFTFAFYLTSRWNDAAKVRFPPNSLFLLAAFCFPSGPRGKVDTLNCDLQWNQHVRAPISCQKAFPTCWLNRISSDDCPITSGLLATSRFSAFPLIPLRGCRPRRPQPLLLFQRAPPWPTTAAGFPVLGCSGDRRVWTLMPPCPPGALNHQSASRSLSHDWTGDWMDLESLPDHSYSLPSWSSGHQLPLLALNTILFSVHAPLLPSWSNPGPRYTGLPYSTLLGNNSPWPNPWEHRDSRLFTMILIGVSASNPLLECQLLGARAISVPYSVPENEVGGL